MLRFAVLLCTVLGVSASLARAASAEEAEIVAAVQALESAKSFTWQQLAGSYGPDRRRNTSTKTLTVAMPSGQPPAQRTGRIERSGFTLVIDQTAKQKLGADVRLVARAGGPRLAETPQGWLTLDEVHAAARKSGPNELADFNGMKVRLSDAWSAATRLLIAREPDAELRQLVNDLDTFTREGDLIVCELSAAGVRRRYARGNEMKVTVVFRLGGGVIQEYLMAPSRPGAPPSLTDTLFGTVMRFSNIDTTEVVVPDSALERLLR